MKNNSSGQMNAGGVPGLEYLPFRSRENQSSRRPSSSGCLSFIGQICMIPLYLIVLAWRFEDEDPESAGQVSGLILLVMISATFFYFSETRYQGIHRHEAKVLQAGYFEKGWSE